MPVLRGRTLKTPKPRSSMRWPFSRARFMASKTVSTASSALDLLIPVRVTTSLTMSSLIKSVLEGEQPAWRPVRGRRASGRYAMERGRHCQGLSLRARLPPALCELRRAGAFRPRWGAHPADEGVTMPIKSDRWIRQMAREHRMIEPFVEEQKRDGVISYGLSSYGYDVRVADEYKIFTNVYTAVVDPKHFDPRSFVEYKGEVLVIPPKSFALARSVEYFRIPRNVLTICMGKSTYARCGIIVNVTPFEPKWEGLVTLEISNTSPLPARVYSGEGICQVVFLEADEVCEVSYKDKKGKYQAQQGIVLPRI